MKELVITIILSYLIGAIPTGFIFCKLIKKIDIRKQGSGNIGATNVFRALGRIWGIVTLLIDIMKGYICVKILPQYCGQAIVSYEAVCVILGVAVIAGHVWTVFLKFKGGKGVATSAGVFLALSWKATLLAIVVFAIVFAISRYVSLGSICSAVALPIGMYLWKEPKLYLIVSMVISVLVVLKHKPNIRRLVMGTEHKLRIKN